jgi:hypothetical protein
MLSLLLPYRFIKAKISNPKIKSAIYTKVPVVLSFPYATTVIAKPGDSINVYYGEENVVYSGKDSNEYELLNEIMKIQKKFVRPTKNSFTIDSLEDFLRWNQYSDDKLALLLPVVESFKDKIPSFNYEYYKADIINWIEFDRIYSFKALRNYAHSTPISGLSSSDLNAIWDSTQYKPSANWFRSLSTFYGAISSLYAFNSLEVSRKFNFNVKDDVLSSKDVRTLLYYNAAKQNYKGLVRERVMAYILDEQAISEMGLKNPMTQSMLKDYFSQPGFPEYKQWVKELQSKAEKKLAKK